MSRLEAIRVDHGHRIAAGLNKERIKSRYQKVVHLRQACRYPATPVPMRVEPVEMLTACNIADLDHSGVALMCVSSVDIAPLAGGVAIKMGKEIVAALGVSGSPGGDKDEACAQAGVASIKQDLASSR